MNMVELAHDLAGIPPQDRLDGMARVVAGWRKREVPKKCGRCYGGGKVFDTGYSGRRWEQDCPDCDGLGTRMVAC